MKQQQMTECLNYLKLMFIVQLVKFPPENVWARAFSALGRVLECESGSGLLSTNSLLDPAVDSVSFFDLLSSCFNTVS